MISWKEDMQWDDASSDENKESKFFIDTVFSSRQDLIDWVHDVGNSLGYVIIIKRSKTSTVTFQCDRDGIYKSTKISSKHTGTKKINCPFKLKGKLISKEDSWIIRVKCDLHNHEPALNMEGHPYPRRLSDNEARLVEDLSRKNLSILKQDPSNVSTISTVYNARNKFRMLEKAGRTQMQVVMSFLHDESYVYEKRINHSTNELEDLFFAHPKSLEMLHAFPHVVLIDATYQTNRYALPLLEIVGVTPTNMTFCIAFVLMHKEDESNYTWALSCLKSLIAPSTTLVREPATNTATRGRPSLKTQSFRKTRVEQPPLPQERRRLSCSSASKFVDVDKDGEYQEPVRHSCCSLDPTRYSYYFHSYMNQLPDMFHPYITYLQDVGSDGNCGFRAIVACLKIKYDCATAWTTPYMTRINKYEQLLSRNHTTDYISLD